MMQQYFLSAESESPILTRQFQLFSPLVETGTSGITEVCGPNQSCDGYHHS